MKKTLMVLSFALCATLAFAQSNTAMRPVRHDAQKISHDASALESTNHEAIFTKTGELMYCNFATENSGYSVGTVGAGETVNGAAVPQHGQVAYHASWHWIADTTHATIHTSAMEANYPYTFGQRFYSLSGFDSESPEQGLMIMTMQDQISAWGGTGTVANFNAYIAFDAFSTTGSSLCEVTLYQLYRKFRDQCWIDYSTDNSTWNALEINVAGIDIAVNAQLLGTMRVTLPAAAGNQANLYLRLRYSSDNNNGGAYGYMWLIDDFKVIATPDNRLTVKTNDYFSGVYQLMPQGLQVPVVWSATFINDGIQAQSNVSATMSAYMDGGSAAEVVSKTMGTIASDPTVTHQMLIDPLGYYDSTADEHGKIWAATNYCTGNTGYMPTTTTGLGHLYSDITSTAISHIYGTETFDTNAFTVNYDATYHNGRATWGHDQGVLRKFSYWTPGISLENPGYWTDDPDDTPWSEAGYGLWAGYMTGTAIPQDSEGNPWRILGVELVPSTYNGMRSSGVKISADLRFEDDTAGHIHYIATGASVYTVQNEDILSGNDFTNLTYRTFGDYPTVFIPFPDQPVLEAHQKYYIGYILEEEGNFAVAANSGIYYSLEDSTAVSYADEPGMEAYAHVVPLTDVWSTMQLDPNDNGLHCYNMAQYPMIRMIVGPAFQVPQHSITFNCGDVENVAIVDEAYEDVCGTTAQYAEGSTHTFQVLPTEEGLEFSSLTIYVDGSAIEFDTLVDDEGIWYARFTLEDLQADHTVSIEATVGIDYVAGVAVKMQPNPATSNVRISLKGVTGNVNYALIDMSGRVIKNGSFNAETGADINVSNLAKGAYFVRITNDKFNKVEKLIVR